MAQSLQRTLPAPTDSSSCRALTIVNLKTITESIQITFFK